MSYDFEAKGQEPINLCVWAWKEILQIALAYGWKPKGTFLPRKKLSISQESKASVGALAENSCLVPGFPPVPIDGKPINVQVIVDREWYLDDGRWSGSYMANGGAVVSKADAIELGKALTRMILEAKREHVELRKDYTIPEIETIAEDADGRLPPPDLRCPPENHEETMRLFLACLEEQIYPFDPRTEAPVDKQEILRRNLNLDWLRVVFSFSLFCMKGKFEIW